MIHRGGKPYGWAGTSDLAPGVVQPAVPASSIAVQTVRASAPSPYSAGMAVGGVGDVYAHGAAMQRRGGVMPQPVDRPIGCTASAWTYQQGC